MQQECLFMLTHLLPKYLLTSYLLLSVRCCPTHREKTCENSRQKLCPWNSSGKDTGVVYHSLDQGLNLGIEPTSPALAGRFFTTDPPGKPLTQFNHSFYYWCFWTVVLEKTLESPLDCEEIQPVNSKGNQSWILIGRTDAEAETPILWPPYGKN